MSDGDKEFDSMNKIVDTSIEIIKSVPIDDDAKVQIGKETGKVVVTVVKAVNLALLPLSAVIYGYENIREFIETRLASKLKEVPPEKIVEPKASVIAGAIESLKYLDNSDDDSVLKEMYANLIANAINVETKSKIHPAFAEIIKQLDPFDVKLLEYLRKNTSSFEFNYSFLKVRRKLNNEKGGEIKVCKWLLVDELMLLFNLDVGKLASSIENLVRLQLIKVEENRRFTDNSGYEAIRSGVVYRAIQMAHGKENITDEHGFLEITNFGQDFILVSTGPNNP